MPRKPVRQTVKDCPEAVGEAAAAAVAGEAPRARGGAPVAPLARREDAIRRAVKEAGDPLVELAKLAATSTDPEFKAACLRAMLPFVHPQQKAVELTGAGGEQLVVEVRKLAEAT